MADEGEFPKVGGDVAYASEANRFASAGRFVSIGSTPVGTSGTDIQEVGSYFISGNFGLSNPCALSVNFYVGGKAVQDIVQIVISGTTGTTSVQAGSGVTGNDNGQFGLYSANTGSDTGGFAGFVNLQMWGGGNENKTGLTDDHIYWASATTSIYPSSGLVIFFNGQFSSTPQFFYNIQSFRSTV